MFSTKNSLLLIIDIQEKLTPLIHENNRLIDHVQRLIKASQLLDIPVIVTEQVPQKIGHTIVEISKLSPQSVAIEKQSFSCFGETRFRSALAASKRRQIIVCGIETHVCVYQTVADLIQNKYQVQVVADAVSARHELDHTIALKRIEQAGAMLATAEMIICELTQSATHEKFREIIQLIK